MTPSRNADRIGDAIRTAYSGERAYETVAYLDRFVRWPGNSGFDAAIDHLAERLATAGYRPEDEAPPGTRLTYRIESYPMDRPAWEPVDASLAIEGVTEPVLVFDSNRNMLATYSHATPPGGIVAELIVAQTGSAAELDSLDVRDKVVFADGSLSRLYRSAVLERGAAGVIAYELPEYLQPETNDQAIQFRGIPYGDTPGWGIALSYSARERLHDALRRGAVRVQVVSDVRWTDPSVERTIIAEIRGVAVPDERFVFSAHVQEPGANDNASGVGAQMEMARVAAALLDQGAISPERSITFLWGDEIRSTRRFVEQDSVRAADIRWGMSLDMVGEDTDKTGGTFLIEKMPDPSAIWTRGDESHTEWGDRPLTKSDMMPHYLNDIVLNRALEQASTSDWVVRTNPYEGGSDHVPFLQAGIPSVLLWHFTDRFYHTDRDRLEMVSADELKNAGVTALATALTLVSADGKRARSLVAEVLAAARSRLDTEMMLGRQALDRGASVDVERDILSTWGAWYDAALESMRDIEVGGASAETITAIEQAREALRADVMAALQELGS